MFVTKATGLLMALLAALVLLVQAQASGQEIKGQVKIGVHKVKLEQGKLYQITLMGPAAANLQLSGPPGFVHRFTFQFGNDQSGETGRSYYVPQKNGEYSFIVAPGGFGFGGTPPSTDTFDYTFKLTGMEVLEKPVFAAEDKLTDADPVYKNQNRYFKSYKIQMTAGKAYIVDLVKAGVQDPYLFLEDGKGNLVASDDDGGGNLNSRLVFSPRQDGEYTIIATTLGKETGGFKLTVQGTK